MFLVQRGDVCLNVSAEVAAPAIGFNLKVSYPPKLEEKELLEVKEFLGTTSTQLVIKFLAMALGLLSLAYAVAATILAVQMMSRRIGERYKQ